MFAERIQTARSRPNARRVALTSVLACIVLVLASMGPGSRFADAGSVPAATLSVTPSSQTRPLAGAPFAVDVRVAGVQDLAAYDVTLTFDPKVIEFVGVSDGGYLTSTGRTAACSQPSGFNGLTPTQNVNANGAFNIHCNTYGLINAGAGTHGPSGSGLLAQVTFRPKGVGISAITFVATAASSPPYRIRAADPAVPGDAGEYGFTGLSSVESCGANGGCAPIAIEIGAAQNALVTVGGVVGCRGDVNGSGSVDSTDMLLVALHFNAFVGDARYDTKFDLNNNGSINSIDMLIVALHFGLCR